MRRTHWPCRLAAILLGAVLLFSAAAAVCAAPTATIAFSAASLSVGDALTVTVTFGGGSVGAVDATLSYDASVLEFVSGNDASGGGGMIRLAGYATAEADSLKFMLTFKALQAGSSTVRIDSSTVYSWDEQLLGNPTAGATVNVQDGNVSQNANLKSLTLSAGSLYPAFSANTTVYTVSVKNHIDSVTISALAADSDAAVRVSGNAALAVGANTRTITVTAPGGAVKVYTVTINRQQPTTTAPPTTTTAAAPASEISWQDAQWHVVAPQEDKLPEGFTAGTVVWQEAEYPAACQEGSPFCLLFLQSADKKEETQVLLSEQDDELLPYLPLKTARGTYLVLPLTGGVPAGMTAAAQKLDDLLCPVWLFDSPELSDFAVLRAIAPDGTVGLFCWDAAESTLQRHVTAAAVTTTTATETVGATTAFPDTSGSESDTRVMWYVIGGAILLAAAFAILLALLRGKRHASAAPKEKHASAVTPAVQPENEPAPPSKHDITANEPAKVPAPEKEKAVPEELPLPEEPAMPNKPEPVKSEAPNESAAQSPVDEPTAEIRWRREPNWKELELPDEPELPAGSSKTGRKEKPVRQKRVKTPSSRHSASSKRDVHIPKH